MGCSRDKRCLVIGLGNPGTEYSSTPHNLGFLTIDRLASEEGIRVTRPECNSLVGRGSITDREIVLAKPLLFMNRSGAPVKALLERYEASPENLLVLFDDLSVPWGSLRLRVTGSAGGHKGVESIIEKLATIEFPRLRLGIHPGRPFGDGADFVLKRFGKEKQEELDGLLGRAADAVRLYLSNGAAKAMTEVNCRADGDLEVK